MPRKNNRDKRYEPKELDINQLTSGYQSDSKPRRKRKDKYDKKIYQEDD